MSVDGSSKDGPNTCRDGRALDGGYAGHPGTERPDSLLRRVQLGRAGGLPDLEEDGGVQPAIRQGRVCERRRLERGRPQHLRQGARDRRARIRLRSAPRVATSMWRRNRGMAWSSSALPAERELPPRLTGIALF